MCLYSWKYFWKILYYQDKYKAFFENSLILIITADLFFSLLSSCTWYMLSHSRLIQITFTQFKIFSKRNYSTFCYGISLRGFAGIWAGIIHRNMYIYYVLSHLDGCCFTEHFLTPDSLPVRVSGVMMRTQQMHCHGSRGLGYKATETLQKVPGCWPEVGGVWVCRFHTG